MAREGWRTKNRRSTMPLERLMPLADCSTVTGANTERNIRSGICDDANVAVISMQSTVVDASAHSRAHTHERTNGPPGSSPKSLSFVCGCSKTDFHNDFQIIFCFFAFRGRPKIVWP